MDHSYRGDMSTGGQVMSSRAMQKMFDSRQDYYHQRRQQPAHPPARSHVSRQHTVAQHERLPVERGGTHAPTWPLPHQPPYSTHQNPPFPSHQTVRSRPRPMPNFIPPHHKPSKDPARKTLVEQNSTQSGQRAGNARSTRPTFTRPARSDSLAKEQPSTVPSGIPDLPSVSQQTCSEGSQPSTSEERMDHAPLLDGQDHKDERLSPYAANFVPLVPTNPTVVSQVLDQHSTVDSGPVHTVAPLNLPGKQPETKDTNDVTVVRRSTEGYDTQKLTKSGMESMETLGSMSNDTSTVTTEDLDEKDIEKFQDRSLGYSAKRTRRKQLRVDVDAVRDAEARGSLTSLSDLIRRATTVATNLERGKTASRLGLDWFTNPDGCGEKHQSSQNSLIDMLDSFPPPAVAEPPAAVLPRDHAFALDGFSADVESHAFVVPPPRVARQSWANRRRHCGLPNWLFAILMAVLVVLSVIALTLGVLFGAYA